MQFCSRVARPAAVPAPVGERVETLLSYEVGLDGVKRLVPSGTRDVQDLIDSHLESVKIENIIRRAQMGDPLALNARQSAYMDVTGMPQSFAELQNILSKAESTFEKLPLDVRRQFDFSVEKYIAMIGTDEWKQIVGFPAAPLPEQPQVDGGDSFESAN